MWMGADGLRQCEHRQRVGEPGTSACCNTVGKRAGLPYVLASRDPGAYNNQGGLPYQPYHTPVSRIYQWTVSAERQFGGFMTEAAYVGSHANGLQFQAGINQVPAGLLGQGQSARPYPQYKAIGPAYSGSLISLFSNISNYAPCSYLFARGWDTA